jgi:hypothetical protein
MEEQGEISESVVIDALKAKPKVCYQFKVLSSALYEGL